jgi:hypothetical protein
MSLSVDCDVMAPPDVESITADWLTAALESNYPGVRVLTCVPSDQMWGMAGKVRVSLTFNERGSELGLPTSMIVKAGFGRFPRDMDWTYTVEVWAYRHVLPTLETNAPKCFFAGIDSEGRSVMILEDLALRGVSFCRILEPLNYRQTAAFLDAFARVHARWWNSPELENPAGLGFLKKLLAPDAAGFWVDHCLQPDAWKQILQTLRVHAIPSCLLDGGRIRHAIERLKIMIDSEPLCLIHGDEHLSNLFLERDGRPGILDWCTRKGLWHMSFGYFLGSALEIDKRRSWEKPLLAYYLERLAVYGVREPPELDQAWLSYRRSLLWGYFVWLTNPDACQIPENNIAASSRFAMAMLDHDTLGLLGA